MSKNEARKALNLLVADYLAKGGLITRQRPKRKGRNPFHIFTFKKHKNIRI